MLSAHSLSKTTLGTTYKGAEECHRLCASHKLSQKGRRYAACIGIRLMGCSGRETRWHQQGPSTMHWQGVPEETIQTLLVITTPEFNTSKTCSLCGSQCGRCEEVDDLHRQKKVVSAQNEAEILKAMRFSVRGLRHCHNASCAAHLNRDHNAAVNIQRRCKQWLFSTPCEDDNMTIEEEVMESLRVLIGHGE